MALKPRKNQRVEEAVVWFERHGRTKVQGRSGRRGRLSEMVSGFITGNASGKAKYVGKSYADTTGDVPATGDLADSDLGTLAAANDCLILNLAEKGSSNTGHDVTAAANTAQFAIYFVGRLRRVNTDGTKVVEVYMTYVGC